MGKRHMLVGAVALVAAIVAVGALRSGPRVGDRSISPAPDQAPAPTDVAQVVASPSPVAPTPNAPVANPLAMTLKHDGPAQSAVPAIKDPCAVAEPTGPLAMRLRHDRPDLPGQPNPLCMRLK